MKKNDGYVIIYVVFVIIFLCIVAVGTCTSALNNLKTQHAVVEQMQDRYTAEGNIEQFMAEVCVAGEAIDSGGDLYSDPDDAETAAKNRFKDTLSGMSGSWVNGNEYVVTLKAVSDSTKIIAEVAFQVSIETYVAHTDKWNEGDKEEPKDYYGYKITDVTSKYISYTLESTGGKAK